MAKSRNKKILSQGRRRVYWWLAAILILTAVVYFRTIYNDFTFWDDPQQVRENTEIRALTFENIKIMFSRYYVNMYQPLTTLSFAIEYHFFGLNAMAFHIDNVILHLFNVVLVFQLILLLSKRKEIALIAACLFGIHPMHVESVAWITERKDVLYALFYLSALIFYIRYVDSERRKKGFYWMALILFLLSCFTKSAAVTLPLVVVLIDWYRQRPFTRVLVWEKISFVVIAMVFGIVSLFSQEVTGTLNVVGNDFSLYQRPLLAAYALMFYFINCAVPIHLSAFHPFERSATGMLPWLYYAAPAPLLIGGYVLWKIRDIKPEIVFGVMFFIAAIVLNLHFIPVGSAIAAERYVYIPYIGLYFLLGYLMCYALDNNIFSIYRRKKVIAAIGMILVLLLSYQTFQRVGAWKDTIALFTDAEIIDGKTAIGDKMLAGAYTYRGEAMLDRGDIQGAMQDLSTAISLYPEFHRALYSRGVAKSRLGDAKNALEDYTNAIAISSNIAIYYNERGSARMDLHDLDSAIVDYAKAIEINPKLAEAYANRARAYFILAKQDECCRDLMKADSLGYKDAARLLKEHCK